MAALGVALFSVVACICDDQKCAIEKEDCDEAELVRPLFVASARFRFDVAAFLVYLRFRFVSLAPPLAFFSGDSSCSE